MSKKLSVATLAAAIVLLSFSTLLCSASPAVKGIQDSKVNVKSFGAVGDSETDDTLAFTRAVAAAKSAKKPVYVPGGTYKISNTITLNGVSLLGDCYGAFTADDDSLPRIVMTNTTVPAFKLQNGTISGLRILDKHTDNSTQTKYKDTIQVTGDNAEIINVKMSDCTKGIVVTGKNVKNLLIENVFMCNPYSVGVHLNNTVNAVLKNVEAWVPSTGSGSPFTKSGKAFWLQNNQNVSMDACFSFNARHGFLFEESDGKGTKAVLNNCSADLATIAISVSGTHNITVSGGTYWTHSQALLVNAGDSIVNISGIDARSNGNDATLNIRGGTNVVIENSSVKRYMKGNRGPGLEVTNAAQDVTVNGCIFYCDNGNDLAVKAWPVNPTIKFTNNLVYNTSADKCIPAKTDNVTVANCLTGKYEDIK